MEGMRSVGQAGAKNSRSRTVAREGSQRMLTGCKNRKIIFKIKHKKGIELKICAIIFYFLFI